MLLSAACGKAVKEQMEGMQTHKIERNKSTITERVTEHKKKDVGCWFYMKGDDLKYFLVASEVQKPCRSTIPNRFETRRKTQWRCCGATAHSLHWILQYQGQRTGN